MTDKGADGYTEAGTWMTYNDIQSMQAIAKVTHTCGRVSLTNAK